MSTKEDTFSIITTLNSYVDENTSPILWNMNYMNS